MITIEIVKTTTDFDSDTVNFIKNGEQTGTGYRSKKTKHYGMERCGDCSRENYSMAVASGVCAWCGWSPNEFKDRKPDLGGC